jgi:hypothetical protein
MKLFTNNQRNNLTRAGVAVLLVSVLGAQAFADTSAYWRHEEGVVGQFVPSGPNTVLDSSGFENHMQTFASGASPFTSASYSSIVSPLALRSGLANNMSLDFGPVPIIGTDDGGGRNDDNYTQDKFIQTELFTAMTVELAFNMHSTNGWQALFGRDGKPLPDQNVPPFKVLIRDDAFPNDIPNQLFVEWIDGDGEIHNVASGETVTTNTWYHMAFTLTATSAELWVAGETGDYVLKDAISGEDFAGPSGEVMIFDPAPLTIGRGMFNGGVTDWSDALIDEVRVSNTALTPNEFLFETLPGGLPGDFNNDTKVDGLDFLVWQRDTSVGNLSDWQNNYGTGGLGAISAVPEPASLALVCGLIGAISLKRRW